MAHRIFKQHLTTAAFVLLAGLVVADRAAEGADHGAFEAKVDAYIKPIVAGNNFSGAILIARGEEILLKKAYGLANYELNVPNTPDTKFHIASVSKPFTSTAIMILEEKGLLSVDDPLTKFIPDYPNGEKITVHHLLTHTSGIPNVNNFPEYDKESRFPKTPEELVAMFKDKPLDFEPGERYSYSNSNYNLLAYIIEKVSGKSYGAFLKETIFDPLGMNDTAHDCCAGDLIINRADGYVPEGLDGVVNAPYLDWSVKTGNGSIYSTVGDLYKWDRALYTEKILRKETLDRMFENNYGWFTKTQFERKLVYGSGRSPGYNAYLARFVDDDVVIIVLGNNDIPAGQRLGQDLAAMVFGEPYTAPRVTPIAVAPNSLGKFAGVYQFGPDFFVPNRKIVIALEGGMLVNKDGGRNTDIVLIPIADNTFFQRWVFGPLTFAENEAGEITEFVYEYGDAFKFTAKRLNN